MAPRTKTASKKAKKKTVVKKAKKTAAKATKRKTTVKAATRTVAKKPAAKTKATMKTAKKKVAKKKAVTTKKAARSTTPAKIKKSDSTIKCKHCKKKFEKETLVTGYCRLCYIATWKANRLRSQIKAEQRLNKYVDKLVRKYPKDYLERLKEGLLDDEKFKEAVGELDTESVNLEVSDDDSTDNEFLEKFVRDIKIEE